MDAPTTSRRRRRWFDYVLWSWMIIGVPLLAGFGAGWWTLWLTVLVIAATSTTEVVIRRRK